MRTAGLDVVVFVVALTVFLVSPVRELMDSNYTVLLSERFLHHRALDFDPASIPRGKDAGAVGDFADYPYQIRVVDGRLYYRYPVASAVLSAPFVAVANLLGIAASAPDGTHDERGERRIQRWLAALLMAGFAVVVLHLARTTLPPAWSLWIALGAALGSPVWSTASRMLWSHTWGILLLAVALLHLMRGELAGRRVRPLLLATLLAWAYFVRPSHLLACVAIGGFLLWRRPRDGAWLVAGVAAWVAAFMALSFASIGQMLPHYHQSGRLAGRVTATVLMAHLVSPSRGLLLYVPTIPFVVWLVARYWRWLPSRPLAILTFAAFVGHLALMSKVRVWWGGFSYGPRFMIETIPWLACAAALGVAAWRAAWRQGAITRVEHGVTAAVGVVLTMLALAIHARGATAIATYQWNHIPVSVDVAPERVWDWHDPQFLAGLGCRATPGESAP